MASEDSPANSARMRLRRGVCALYRARAADPEKSIYCASGSSGLAIGTNDATADRRFAGLKGVVQLSGFVSSRDDIQSAIEVGSAANCVKSVKNDM
jgi:hypothetical protein